MLYICKGGHILKRSPAKISVQKTTRCGWCGERVCIRPLTDQELEENAKKPCAKTNTFSVSVMNKARHRHRESTNKPEIVMVLDRERIDALAQD